MDACVLIDFVEADRRVLGIISKHVGPVHVVTTIVDEVNAIETEQELVELGLTPVEPEPEDVSLAVAGAGRRLALHDLLCFFTAKRQGFTCVTNDRALRKKCQEEKMRPIWGLELLRLLYKAGGIPARDAIELAERIHLNNPTHITADILKRFIASIGR